MILADKIIELRKKNGWSQEELAERLNVSRQSVSKWEGAQSVPDMNRIIQLSEIFGVSTDFLLKDDMEMPSAPVTTVPAAVTDDYPDVHAVSMEEATLFLDHKYRAAGRVALGVMMCILSPVLLIVLMTLRDAGIVKLTETAALGPCMIVLFLLVGGAVALFVITYLQGKRFEYFEYDLIDTMYGVDGMVRDRKEKFRPAFTAQLVCGIVLCVISAMPIFIALWLYGDNEIAGALGTAVLLVLVAIGVLLIVHASIIWGGFQMLLEEGDYTPARKMESRKNERIAAIYWGLITAVYLAISFLTGAWHRTWIIWPVAGVTYGVVTAIARVLRNRA